MKVSAEVFKGIEFVRISNLPENQKQFIETSLPKDKIIYILKEKAVMKDCVQYHDYITFYNLYKEQFPAKQDKITAIGQDQSEYKFAI